MSHYSNHLFTPGTRNNSWAHLFEYISEGDRVLDVGCSSGNFGEALIQLKSCEVIGLDLDEADIKTAKTKLTKAIIGDINDTKIYAQLGTFDALIFADVVEHLANPRETLKLVKKLLKKDGKLLFSIPHMGHSSVRLDLLAGKFPYKERGLLDKTHLHFYDKAEFESVFMDAGYDIAKNEPVIALYPTTLFKEKMEKLGIPYSKKFESLLKETDGDLFQFVGYAVPSQKPRKKQSISPYVMPQDEVYNLAQRAFKENEELQKQLDNLNQKFHLAAAASRSHRIKAKLLRSKKHQ